MVVAAVIQARHGTLVIHDREVKDLVDKMMLKSRAYVKAISARDEALAVTCKSQSKEDESAWEDAVKAAERAHDELHAVIRELRAAREER